MTLFGHSCAQFLANMTQFLCWIERSSIAHVLVIFEWICQHLTMTYCCIEYHLKELLGSFIPWYKTSNSERPDYAFS